VGSEEGAAARGADVEQLRLTELRLRSRLPLQRNADKMLRLRLRLLRRELTIRNCWSTRFRTEETRDRDAREFNLGFLLGSLCVSMPNYTSNRIEVPLSRAKIVLILLGSAGFVAIAIAIWPAVSLTPRGSLEIVIALAAAIVFFGACGLYALWKLFDAAPGLVIDEQGIVDNSSGISAGRIPWSDIVGVHVTTLRRQRFLTIEVSEPTKYVERASFLKRQMVRLNAKYFGGPIQISAIALKIDFDELVNIISRRFAEHRRA
jgi:hypothetical protein